MPHSDGYGYNWSPDERPRKYRANELSTMYRGVLTNFARNILDVNDHLESLERRCSDSRSYRNRYEYPPFGAPSYDSRRLSYHRLHATPERRFNDEYYRNVEYGDSAGRATPSGWRRNEHDVHQEYNEHQIQDHSGLATSRSEGERVEGRENGIIDDDSAPSEGTARLPVITEIRSVCNNEVEEVRVGDEVENSASEERRRKQAIRQKKSTSSTKKKLKSWKTNIEKTKQSSRYTGYAGKEPIAPRPETTVEKRRIFPGGNEEVDDEVLEMDNTGTMDCALRRGGMEDSTEHVEKEEAVSQLKSRSISAVGEESYSAGELFSDSLAAQRDNSGEPKTQKNARQISAASGEYENSMYEEESSQGKEDEEMSEASVDYEHGRERENYDDDDNDDDMLDICDRNGENRVPQEQKTSRESAQGRKRRLAAARREIERENVPKQAPLPMEESRQRFQRTRKKKMDPDNYRTAFSDGYAHGFKRAMRICKLFAPDHE